VIDDILKYSARIIGMAIEFHDTGRLKSEFTPVVANIQKEFELIHIHANNWGGMADDGLPEYLELSFVRKDFCSGHAAFRWRNWTSPTIPRWSITISTLRDGSFASG
jgi:hypothetical protein